MAIQLSLRVAMVATLVATPLGIAVGWILARRDFWGKSLVDALIHLPLVLPPVVTGYLLLLTFGRRGLVGAWLADHLGIVFAFRWTGAALACGIMAFPLLVRPIRLSIEAVDRRLEQAAGTLGAAPWGGVGRGPGGYSPASRCRWRCRACLPAWCWALPRRWANSAPPSPSFPAFPAKPR